MEGLVAYYNMRMVNNKLINCASPVLANGGNPGLYDGIVSKCQSIKNGIQFNRGSYVTFSNTITLSNSYSISVRVSPNLGEFYIFNGTSFIGINTTQLYFYTANIGITYTKNWNLLAEKFYTITLKVEGITLYTYVDGFLYDKHDFLLNPIVVFSNISRSNANTQKSIIGDIRIYNRALTEKEIKSYHNSFVSRPVLSEDFSQYAVGSSKFGNWTLLKTIYTANAWTIGEITSLGKYLPKGTKYLKPTGNTINDIKIQQPIAYGTWEFIAWVDNLSLGSSIAFIYSNTGVYRIWLYQGALYMGKDGGVNLIPNFYTPVIGEQFKVKITRNTSGIFKVWVNDVYRGTGTDNTYTTSKYLEINTYSSHFKIANLEIYPGITV